MCWAGLSTRRILKAPISIYCNLKYLNINTRRINYAVENKIAWTFKRKHRFSEGVCSLGWMDSHGSAHTWSVFLFAFEQCDPVYFPVPPSGHREGRAQGHLTTSLLRSNLPPCVYPSGVWSLPAILLEGSKRAQGRRASAFPCSVVTRSPGGSYL